MRAIDIDKVIDALNGDLYGRWSEKVGGHRELRDLVERVMYYAEDQMVANTMEYYKAVIDELTHSSQFYKEMYDQLAAYIIERSRDLASLVDELNDRMGEEE